MAFTPSKNEKRQNSVCNSVAQILLTADDIEDPTRHENFQNTIQRLLELDAIPILNENDTVSVAEFGIGDNDTLSAKSHWPAFQPLITASWKRWPTAFSTTASRARSTCHSRACVRTTSRGSS